ncbi:MAG: hypothetical protein ACI4TI_00465, partial [Christensenellales bacterium]
MDLIKKMLKYLFILVIIAVLAFALIASVLFFFPNLSLFGIRYAAKHNNAVALETESVITKVNVETNNYDIVIVPNSEESVENPDNTSLRVVIEDNYTGFSKNGISSTQIKKVGTEEFVDSSTFNSISLSTFKKGGELTIVLNEPVGLISYGSSKVAVFLPETATGVEYNLKTNTGKISFEKSAYDKTKVLSTKNITLSVLSALGSFNLDNASMQDGSDLVISNYIGRVEINSEKIGNVKINSNSGNFTFKSIGYEGFDGGDLIVEGNNPYVRVTDTVYGDVTYTNVITGFVEIKEIKGDLIYECQNGILRVDKVLGNVTSKNISGETTIKQINEAGKERTAVSIESESGLISLGTDETSIYSLANVTTKSGRVVIKNLAEKNAVIQSMQGSVSVDFAKDNVQKNLKVTTVSGAVTLNNVYGNMDIKTENGSKIYAQFDAFSAESSFVTDGGEIELVV